MHLLDNIDANLTAECDALGLPAYRRKQMRKWLLEKRAKDWDAMSDLPKAPREELAERSPFWTHADRPAHAGPTAPKSCCSRSPTAGRSNACCCAMKSAARSASARKSAAAWAACFARAGSTAWTAISRPAKSSSKCCGCNACSDARRAAQPHRRDGHGRAAGESRRAAARARRSHAATTAWASAAADHDFHRRPAEGDATAGRATNPLSPGRFAARTERRAAATSSCR